MHLRVLEQVVAVLADPLQLREESTVVESPALEVLVVPLAVGLAPQVVVHRWLRRTHLHLQRNLGRLLPLLLHLLQLLLLQLHLLQLLQLDLVERLHLPLKLLLLLHVPGSGGENKKNGLKFPLTRSELNLLFRGWER